MILKWIWWTPAFPPAPMRRSWSRRSRPARAWQLKTLYRFLHPGHRPAGWERCLTDALASADRMIEAERKSAGRILYAENWVYAPGVQKALRLLRAAETPILRVVAEESHSGTHSRYGMEWKTSGGGSLLNKGCHPLGGAIYLKYAEGQRRLGRSIRPRWVMAASGI